VAGQLEAKWAAEVAAAGRHHLLFTGPPGVGKTMIAARLPGLLPDLTVAEALEVSAVHSLAGFDLSDGLVRRPPYAEPHHSASMASIVGGGPGLARPGAVSCAHRGVLFLDEAPEFSVKVLEALRVPLESGVINLNRSHGLTRYPARFQLVMAANPCPCGQSGTVGTACVCPPMAVRRYATKLSAPIRDRVDITQFFRPLKRHQLKVTLAQGEPEPARHPGPRGGVGGVLGELDDEPVPVAAEDEILLGVGVLTEPGGTGRPGVQNTPAQTGRTERIRALSCRSHELAHVRSLSSSA
jgi:magnesium chelatase family protein